MAGATTIKYRRPTREEQTVINRALDRWGAFDALASSGAAAFAFLVRDEGPATKKKQQVCIIASRDLAEKAVALNPRVAGLAIGKLGGKKKKQFTPTLQGADLFARVGKKKKEGKFYYVAVGDAAEKLVLYGRDVMGDSVLEASPELGENELVILVNARGEALGIGRTRFAGRSLLQKGRVTITTLADAGSYLRDESGRDEGNGGSSEGRAKIMRPGSATAAGGGDADANDAASRSLPRRS